jgi:hypothetical protein
VTPTQSCVQLPGLLSSASFDGGNRSDNGLVGTIPCQVDTYKNENTIFGLDPDLKVSSHQPNKTQTFQVLMYYLMAYYSGEPQFRAIQYLTLLNPRRGIAYRVAVNELFAGAVGIVSKGILGFPDSPRDM